jgi:hypothetical protein
MPEEVSVDATYRVILGQDSMRALGIDTGVLSNSITWKISRSQWYHEDTGYWNYATIMLNGETLSRPLSQNLSNDEVPIKVLLHDEADEPSYTSNILPSVTVSHVEEDIVETKSICKDLQRQISRLSLEVEEERSQCIQIKAEYKTQLAAVPSKNELELEKALESIQLLQKHSDNVTALKMEANAVSAQNEARVEKLKQMLHKNESSLPMQQLPICNQIHNLKFMGEQESTIAPASSSYLEEYQQSTPAVYQPNPYSHRPQLRHS